MTSLDFQSLLRQEKAKCRVEMLREKNAAQPSIVTITKSTRDARPSTISAAGASTIGDGDIDASREERSPAVGEGVDGNDVWRRSSGLSSLSLAELAARPSLDLEMLRVGLTSSIFYAPDFVSESEGKAIFSKLYSGTNQPKTSDTRNAADSNEWVTLRSRRLQCWGGQPGEDFKPQPLPPWMDSLCDALVARGVFPADERPNHVLVNEYRPGQGIMPHTDGPFYEARTATLSLVSDAIMHFSPRLTVDEIGQPGVESRPQFSVVLRARCLVVFADEAYSRLLHGINTVREEVVGVGYGVPVVNLDAAGAQEGDLIRRRLRVSLTFRRVTR